jgi:tetratricopeptide (TPR) repeat protein
MLRNIEARHEEAVAAAAQALDLKPDLVEALRVAVVSLQFGLADPERAAQFAQSRAARAPEVPAMAFVHASLAAHVGDRAAALASVRHFAQADPPHLPSVSLGALLCIEAGDHAGARDLLRRGIDAVPEATELHHLLAQAYLCDPSTTKDGEPQEPARGLAIAELRTAVRLLPSHAPSLNNLAWLLARDDATRAEALAFAEAAVKAQPANPAYLDTNAAILVRIGRADKAVALLRAALGALETQRKALAPAPAAEVSAAQRRRTEDLARRLEATTAQVRDRYEQALRLSGGR